MPNNGTEKLGFIRAFSASFRIFAVLIKIITIAALILTPIAVVSGVVINLTNAESPQLTTAAIFSALSIWWIWLIIIGLIIKIGILYSLVNGLRTRNMEVASGTD